MVSDGRLPAWYLRQVRSYPRLEREAERELARRWKQERDPRAGEALITSSLRLVVAVAARYARWHLPMADLVAEGNLGLLHALDKYDPDRGTRLSTYAEFWIRAYILRYLQRTRSLVSSMVYDQWALFRRASRVRARLAVTGQAGAALERRVATELGVTPAALARVEQRFRGYDDALDEVSPEALREDGNPERQAELAELAGLLEQAAKDASLDERERFVVQSRLLTPPGSELSFAEIGRRLGVTREWARQLERRAMRKIDHRLAELR